MRLAIAVVLLTGLSCSSADPVPTPAPTLAGVERFRACMDETASAQTAEDEGRATPQLRERLLSVCVGSGTVVRAEDGFYDCSAGRDIQERLKLIIEDHLSLGRPATFAAMAKRELDSALVAVKC